MHLLLNSLLYAAISSAIILPIIFYDVWKNERRAAKNNLELARQCVKCMIEEISSPIRHRWVETSSGSAIQFVYLLHGRGRPNVPDPHLIWAEITIHKQKPAEVTLFHTARVSKDDTFLTETIYALKACGFLVTVEETTTQPDLAHTGVR